MIPLLRPSPTLTSQETLLSLQLMVREGVESAAVFSLARANFREP